MRPKIILQAYSCKECGITWNSQSGLWTRYRDHLHDPSVWVVFSSVLCTACTLGLNDASMGTYGGEVSTFDDLPPLS